jgi:hypothetical protein
VAATRGRGRRWFRRSRPGVRRCDGPAGAGWPSSRSAPGRRARRAACCRAVVDGRRRAARRAAALAGPHAGPRVRSGTAALSWLIAWLRPLTALQRAIRSVRISSTRPSRVFGFRRPRPRARPPQRRRRRPGCSGALVPARPPDRPVDLDNDEPGRVQVPRERWAVGAGAFDADLDDLAVGPGPVHERLVAAGSRQGRRVGDLAADRVDDRRVVGVDPDRDGRRRRCHPRHVVSRSHR